MKFKFLSTVVITALAFCLFLSCGGDNSTNSNQQGATEINAYVVTLPELSQPDEAPYVITTDSTVEIGRYICQSESYSGRPGFSTMIFSRTNSDILYPGALLDGASVNDGSYTLCNLERAPITLTVNLQSLSGNISKTIENPAYSTIQSGIHEILSQEIVGDAGAEMTWEVESIYSETHLKAALGLNIEVAKVFGVKGDFSFEGSVKYQRVIAKYTQKYYDVIIDQPTDPSKFLDLSNTTIEEVKAKMGDVSPMYIASVSYGRFALFYFQSEDLSFDLKAAVEAFVDIPVEGVPVEIGGSGSFEFGSVFKHTSCKAYILGGSGADASAAVTSSDKFLEYLQKGGKYSKDSPGKPISFNLRYLSNNKPVKLIVATNYEKTTCSKVANKYRIKFKDFKVTKNTFLAATWIDLYGKVNLVAGGQGDPTGGGTAFTGGFGQKVHINTPLLIGNSVDVEFKTLSYSDRQHAYIEIDISTLKANNIDYFTPNKKRIYLHELVIGQDFTFVFKTKSLVSWHTVTLTYDVEELE